MTVRVLTCEGSAREVATRVYVPHLHVTPRLGVWTVLGPPVMVHDESE
jgi:hypothetical protein